MITVYFLTGADSMEARTLHATEALPERVLWIDLLHPAPEEEESMARQLGIHIPTREQIWKNETLNRFYEEDGLHYLTAAIITKLDGPYPNTSAVTFILAEDYLLTLRHISPTSFRQFSDRIVRKHRKFTSGACVLEGLLEEIISRVAYNAEHVVSALDKLSHDIFGTEALERRKGQITTAKMKDILLELGKDADLNSKINESLHSLARLVDYFSQINGDKQLSHAVHTLDTDIRALIKQTAFLSDKITFLLDTALGLINVEQNTIIKLFSVVTVILLPPTLVGSIYGMNFEHMPELHWAFGYPVAIGLMAACALLPYLYFREKGML